MDHFRHPRNVGEMPDADGIGEVGNAKCGDIMRMYIKVKNNIITDVKFMTFGCGSAIATSSIATELIKGKPVDEAVKLSNQAVVEALDGLPVHKLHCSVLAEEAIKAAVKDYYDKHNISYDKDKYCVGDCACAVEHEHSAKKPAKTKTSGKSTKSKNNKAISAKTNNTTKTSTAKAITTKSNTKKSNVTKNTTTKKSSKKQVLSKK